MNNYQKLLIVTPVLLSLGYMCYNFYSKKSDNKTDNEDK